MPDQNAGMLPPLGADPEAWAQFLRQQQLSQFATGAALTPPQPQMYGKMISRVSPLSGVAQVAKALMARRAQNQLFDTQNKLYSSMGPYYSGPSVSGGQNVQPQDDQSVMPAGGQAPMQFHPAGPGYVPGVDPQVAMRAAMANPTEFAKLQQGPTAVALGRYAGADTQATAQAALTKELSQTLRPGQTLIGPHGEQFMAANPERGEFYQSDGKGGWQAVPITNSSLIEAMRTYQNTSAKEQATPHWEANPFRPGQANASYAPPPNGVPGSAGPPAPQQVAASQPPPGAAPTAPPQQPPTRTYFQSPPRANGGTAADLEAQKQGAQSGQNYADSLVQNANAATKLRRGLAELKNLSSTAGVAVSNDAKLRLGSMLIAAGADPNWVSQSLHTDIGALTAAGKQTGSLALNSVHEMTSRGTNFDLQTFIGYNPRLDMSSPDGFRRAVQYIDGTLKDEIDRQADFTKWKVGNSPADWATGHTTHWLQKENDDIDAGRTISNRSFQSEEDARAAYRRGYIGEGDRITVGGKVGAWHGE